MNHDGEASVPFSLNRQGGRAVRRAILPWPRRMVPTFQRARPQGLASSSLARRRQSHQAWEQAQQRTCTVLHGPVHGAARPILLLGNGLRLPHVAAPLPAPLRPGAVGPSQLSVSRSKDRDAPFRIQEGGMMTIGIEDQTCCVGAVHARQVLRHVDSYPGYASGPTPPFCPLGHLQVPWRTVAAPGSVAPPRRVCCAEESRPRAVWSRQRQEGSSSVMRRR